jgi:hypothetical protein
MSTGAYPIPLAAPVITMIFPEKSYEVAIIV